MLVNQIFRVSWQATSYLAALAISFVMVTTVFPQEGQAQEKPLPEKGRTLTVTAQGEQKIPTTLTEVRLGVEVQGQSAVAVQQEVAQRTAAVVNLLRARNPQRLQTTGIQLQPSYRLLDDQQQLNGYIGTNTVSFRLPTEAVGTLIDEAVKAGATRIDGISFTATEEAISGAQQQALTSAVQEAQRQAQVVLQSLNLSPKEIVTIQINGAGTPIPLAYESAALARAADNTPVIGGEQTVSASVTLQISY